MNKREYVSDKIGEDYKTWFKKPYDFQSGVVVKISAPTGSGKSHFIFYTLLPYVIQNGGKILYLVNRKVLKEQLEKELQVNVSLKFGIESVQQFIRIKSYQSLEKESLELLKNSNSILYAQMKQTYGQYTVVVCDECHYFYTDSNFNTNTQISFDIIRGVFQDKIQIFMSATMEPVEKYINKRTKIMDAMTAFNTQYCIIKESKRIYSYEIPTHYENISVSFFDDDTILRAMIKERLPQKEKWLIFTDSISNGENLAKELKAVCENKEDVIFVDADYEKRIESSEEIKNLTENFYVNKKVIIATSVLDNGVSFHDVDLRNIVILCDTEEEFIQMLGRKRDDGHEIRLYICRRSQDYFRRRTQHMQRIWKFRQNRSFHKLFYKFNGENAYVDIAVSSEQTFRQDIQNDLLNEIWNNKASFEKAKSILMLIRGILVLNEIAVDRCRELCHYYSEMAENIKTDRDIFLKKQLSWLGLGSDVLQNARIEQDNAHKKLLEKELEELFVKKDEVVLNKEDNKNFKCKCINSLQYFHAKATQDDEKKKNEEGLKKNDRPITPEVFNVCMNVAVLPYKMDKKSRTEYRIVKK